MKLTETRVNDIVDMYFLRGGVCDICDTESDIEKFTEVGFELSPAVLVCEKCKNTEH